jgi:hypothetical protein
LNANPTGVTIYDTTPPELKTTFNTTTKSVSLSGVDLIDPAPTYAKTGNTITLKDTQTNTTTIALTKYESESKKLEYAYNSITRNGTTTTVPTTSIKYEWDTQGALLKQLDISIKIQGEEKYSFKYDKEKNETKVKVKTGNNTTIMTKIGLVNPALMTDSSILKVTY